MLRSAHAEITERGFHEIYLPVYLISNRLLSSLR